MDQLAHRHLALDSVEEADELLMPVALHATSDHSASQHVKGGEQGGCAVTFVVVGHGAAPTALKRQSRLSAIERLNLALLIDRQHDGVGRWIDIEADNVAQLGREMRIIGQLELTQSMRPQSMGTPDALHRTEADAH